MLLTAIASFLHSFVLQHTSHLPARFSLSAQHLQILTKMLIILPVAPNTTNTLSALIWTLEAIAPIIRAAQMKADHFRTVHFKVR